MSDNIESEKPKQPLEVKEANASAKQLSAAKVTTVEKT